MMAAPSLTLLWLDFGQIVMVNLFTFQFVNLMSWWTLIYHMNAYKDRGKRGYDWAKAKIKRFETWIWRIFVGNFLFTNSFWIFIAVIQGIYECERLKADTRDCIFRE